MQIFHHKQPTELLCPLLFTQLHQVEMAPVTEERVTEGRQLGLAHFVDLHMYMPCAPRYSCILHIYQEYILDDLSGTKPMQIICGLFPHMHLQQKQS